jgi:hypothetical protein
MGQEKHCGNIPCHGDIHDVWFHILGEIKKLAISRTKCQSFLAHQMGMDEFSVSCVSCDHCILLATYRE